MKIAFQLKLHKPKFKRDKDHKTYDKILLQQYLPKILNFLCLLTQIKIRKINYSKNYERGNQHKILKN